MAFRNRAEHKRIQLTTLKGENMKIQSQKDFFSGLMFMSVGVAFALGASNYKIGNGAKMGPGYFPIILGVILTLIGVAVTTNSLLVATPDGEKIGKIAWKPLFFIITANLVFGAAIGGVPEFGIPPLGLIIGIVLLAFISALAGDEFNFKEVAILSAILTVMSYLAFVVLLKLQFPVWPTFITA
jgi:hypothetical protein